MFDEPYGTNVNANALNHAWAIYPPYVKDILNAVANQLKAIAPQVPSVIVFGADEIHYPIFFSDLVLAAVSWIGFDCYRFEEPNGRCSDSDINQLLQNFQKVAQQNGQGLVLVPDAFSALDPASYSAAQLADDQYETVQRLRLYKNFSGSSAIVKAIYPWMFQHVNGADGKTACRTAESFGCQMSLPGITNEISK